MPLHGQGWAWAVALWPEAEFKLRINRDASSKAEGDTAGLWRPYSPLRSISSKARHSPGLEGSEQNIRRMRVQHLEPLSRARWLHFCFLFDPQIHGPG